MSDSRSCCFTPRKTQTIPNALEICDFAMERGIYGQTLWSSGQEFLHTDPEVRVRFPVLPDFLRSSMSGTGTTQPRTTEELLGRKGSGSGLEIRETAVGIRSADHMAPSIRNELAPTSLGQYSSLADSGHGVYFAFCLKRIYTVTPQNIAVRRPVPPPPHSVGVGLDIGHPSRRL
jgi:hypothetical protein